MATATLNFDLSESQDRQEFLRATKALNMALAIWEYDQWLRGEYKHGENEAAYAFRNKFREFLTDNDLDIDLLLQ
jgi:N-acetyl-anhydromuramyl-L-alanine amidase AmpD